MLYKTVYHSMILTVSVSVSDHFSFSKDLSKCGEKVKTKFSIQKILC